jgi:hypothetical protein
MAERSSSNSRAAHGRGGGNVLRVRRRLGSAEGASGASVTAIARDRWSPAQLYGWRRQARAPAAIGFAPVRIESDVLAGARIPREILARYAGIVQADADDGFNQIYLAARHPGAIRGTACWPHARRPFFAMAAIEENARRKAASKKEISLSPIAIEVVGRIDALFDTGCGTSPMTWTRRTASPASIWRRRLAFTDLGSSP